MSNLEIAKYIQRHNEFLHNYINETDVPADRLKEAIMYSLFPGGKRFRPTLVYVSGEILNVPLEILDIIAASIELMHSFSLVHDDLPAMDDDDYRRDKLSCHRAFDEATAILAGDAIQALAVDILVTKLPEHLSLDKILVITHELLQACGPAGMVSGQSLDMTELAKDNVDKTILTKIHNLKTGKLIAACINMVLASTNPEPHVANTLSNFAMELGILFQMQDDYLDQYGAANCLGKLRSSDQANNKVTFASIFTASELLNLIEEKYNKITSSLSTITDKSNALMQIILNLQAKVLAEVSA